MIFLKNIDAVVAWLGVFNKHDPWLQYFLQGTGPWGTVRLLHVPEFRVHVCVYNRKAGYAHTAGSDSCWLRASSCQLAARRAAGAQPCDSCCRNTSRRMQQPGARAPSSATVRRITAIAGLCPPGNFAHRGAVCVTCARIHWFGQMPTMATHTARAACVLHRRVSSMRSFWRVCMVDAFPHVHVVGTPPRWISRPRLGSRCCGLDYYK